MCECCKQLKSELSAKDQKIDALDQELRLALQTIEMMRRRMFGRSSEQTVPGQGTFDNLLAECDDLNGNSPQEAPETEKLQFERRKKNGNLNGRMKIPDHLERVEKFIDLPENEKTCPVTGQPLVRIGEEITEQLAYKPGKLYAIRYIRPKYVSPDRRLGNEVGVKTAQLPEGPIDRCKADVSLLSHVLVSKYCDHQPLHRQQLIFSRHGMELPKSSMGDWVKRSADALKPLYDLIRKTVLASDYINADDTPVMFKSGKRKESKKGRMWSYLCRINDPPDDVLRSENKLMFFDFTEDWSEQHPIKVLKNFKGSLQSDGYTGFQKITARDGVVQISCWAHARRKFYEAAKVGNKEAQCFVTLINTLYRIEHRIADMKKQGIPDCEILEHRKIRAGRTMNKFFRKVKLAVLLPKSPLGKALTYARNQEHGLRNYVNELHFTPDNNAVENALRPLCLGKKNYMMLGSEYGGKTAAIIYTMIGSCKTNEVNPYEYLKDVLTRINSLPHKKLTELLPHNWKPLQG